MTGHLLAHCVARRRMPGAAWWIEEIGRAVDCGSVGHAALEPLPVKLIDDTPFDLASLTKPLCTALLALLLEQESVWRLDDPAADSLGELRDSPYRAVTLRQLANHTAGLPAWAPLYLDAGDAAGYLAAIAATPPAGRAGRAIYSDLGYILLGFAIERVAAHPLDDLFYTHVARPLGLKRLGFATDDRFLDAAATERGNAYEAVLAGEPGRTHAWRTEVIRGRVHDGNAHALGGVAGHAGLFGPVSEVAAVLRELVEPKFLPLDPGARAAMLEPDPRNGWSVGMVSARASSAARGIFDDDAPGHTGFSGTSFWIEPAGRRISVLLTNRVHPIVDPSGIVSVRRGFHRVARRTTARLQ